MNLKFIGLLLILVLTALCGLEFGGEVFAAGEGRCAPVNFESVRSTAAAVDTPDRGNGVTVFGMMDPAMTGMEKLLPDSWKKSGFIGEYAEVQPCGEQALPGTAGKKLRPDFRGRPRHRLYSELPAGRSPPVPFC